MSAGESKTWLVCYDIAEPRRLRRVHRTVRREGSTVQYSAYAVTADDEELRALLGRIEAIIVRDRDDVRAYHLPQRCQIWTMGTQGLPDGVEVDAVTAARLLVEHAAVPAPLELDDA